MLKWLQADMITNDISVKSVDIWSEFRYTLQALNQNLTGVSIHWISYWCMSGWDLKKFLQHPFSLYSDFFSIQLSNSQDVQLRNWCKEVPKIGDIFRKAVTLVRRQFLETDTYTSTLFDFSVNLICYRFATYQDKLHYYVMYFLLLKMVHHGWMSGMYQLTLTLQSFLRLKMKCKINICKDLWSRKV